MFPLFPFFPFAFVPPVPFVAPFAGPFAAFFPFAGARPGTASRTAGDSADTAPSGPPDAHPAQALMSLAMLPFAAPITVSTQMAQAVRDAGQVARDMRDALERDEGPVHVMIGDPEKPGGLAIGITLYRRGEEPALRDVRDVGAPALGAPDDDDRTDPGMVDVTPPPAT